MCLFVLVALSYYNVVNITTLVLHLLIFIYIVLLISNKQ